MSPALAAKDAPSGPQPGDLVAGRYRVGREIGQGGMGRVLAATNEVTGKQVALKWVLDPQSGSAGARFAREARAAGRIHHPNVVDVYDVIEHHDGTPCIVMELLRGESLADRLARTPRLPIDEAVSIAAEIARGIAAAHDGGVIHRDLKPGNIFLPDSDDGRIRVKVLDFGISKIVEASPELVTHTGVVLGTPTYLSPEQVRGAPDIDGRVDVYAMGAVLYEMLVGHPPHQNPHIPALLVDIVTVVPVAPHLLRGDVPEELSHVVMRALARDRAERIPDARSFVDAVAGRPGGQATVSGESKRASLELMPTLEAPTPTPPPLSRRTPTRSLVVAIAVAAILGLAALGWSLGAGTTPHRIDPDPTPGSRTQEAATTVPAPGAIVAPTAEAPPLGVLEPAAEAARAEGRPVEESPAEESETAPTRTRARRPEITQEGTASVGETAPVATVAPPEPEPEEPAVTTTTTTPEPRAGRIGIDDL